MLLISLSPVSRQLKITSVIIKRHLWAALLFSIATSALAQREENLPTLNIGDKAPHLQVGRWLKGNPISQFEKGKVYVLEFWATWCRPCNAAMPHLSALARAYKDTVTFIGVDIYELPAITLQKVQAFVDSIGVRMDYNAAAQDSNFMEASWMHAAGEQSIPKSFIINADGKLAWVGEPYEIDTVLREIINNTWSIPVALAKRNLNRRLEYLDREAGQALRHYMGDAAKLDYIGKPDSALIVISEITKKAPGLTYAPIIANFTFSSLLKTNMQKALEYGKQVLRSPTYDDPASDAIIYGVEWYSDKIFMPAEMYHLAAEAYQVKIDCVAYPEITNMFKLYHNMADLYVRSNDKEKAIAALERALEMLKNQK